jgi:arsenate reductase (glutaredoxin)
MKKLYFLSTCTTCARIMSEMNLDGFDKIEIKSQGISEADLEEMYSLTNSYEALFSKIARKYKELDLKSQNLQEEDYKRLILDEYTFLKRPVIIVDEKIFVGNSKKMVEEAKKIING